MASRADTHGQLVTPTGCTPGRCRNRSAVPWLAKVNIDISAG